MCLQQSDRSALSFCIFSFFLLHRHSFLSFPLFLWPFFASCILSFFGFFSLCLCPCLSLQCSPLLKARRQIQKKGSAWRCVVSIPLLFQLVFLDANALCQPFFKPFTEFHPSSRGPCRKQSWNLHVVCVFLDSKTSRGSLHSHLRGALQVSASGEERLGAAVSKIPLFTVCVWLCVIYCQAVQFRQRRKCTVYLDKILLTFTHHLPLQQDDCRGFAGVRLERESMLGGHEGQTAALSVLHKKKRSLCILVGAGNCWVWNDSQHYSGGYVCTKRQHIRHTFTWIALHSESSLMLWVLSGMIYVTLLASSLKN